MPAELSPLVQAINEYARRLDQYSGAQRVFIQNAAHQLRTPLTLLTTQVSYALRTPDGAGREESLAAAKETAERASGCSSRRGWPARRSRTVLRRAPLPFP